MDFRIFEQIGAVPGIIRGFKGELIGMQFQYAIEKANTLKNFCINGIGTKGTIEQYNFILDKLFHTGIEFRNLHDVLTEDEIKLLGPDKYLEEDYSYWYKDCNELVKE